VAPVALINAGGPAMCNYYAADNDASQGAFVSRREGGREGAACTLQFKNT
jgi:hypothetical protein